MTDFLEQVVASRREYVRDAKARRPIEDLLRRPIRRVPGPGRFGRALRDRASTGHLGVIAEVKRTSPALGTLASAGLSAADQALRYEAAGATAISVLTEPRFWGGSLEDLAAVRAVVSIPVLCKDVIVDEYQIAQAYAAGADAVLLIAEALSDAELRHLRVRAGSLSLDTLVEAHESVAFGRAVGCGSLVVGINARNLRDPKDIDIGRARQLHSFAKEGQILVAESGIASADDARLLPARVDAVLVGTALMRAGDPAPLIRALAGIRRTGKYERTTVTVIER
ncbi:MAG TPA: indole-3-glycerol phosphate synthase TrpC [Methylomirabilota bacterium]|nr:indole-3-glycerol phosphate synthase TrpC [Methylomirabilota bacterium]